MMIVVPALVFNFVCSVVDCTEASLGDDRYFNL